MKIIRVSLAAVLIWHIFNCVRYKSTIHHERGGVTMADIKNRYGELVYRIEGDRILDKYGEWQYNISGDRILDKYGEWKYTINGDYLYDKYGDRLGEMRDLADLLQS